MVKCNLSHNQICVTPMIETKRPSKVLSPVLHCIYIVFHRYFSSLHYPLSSIFPPISHLQLFLPPVSQCNGAHCRQRSDKRYSSCQKLSTTLTSSWQWHACKHKEIEEIWVNLWSKTKTELAEWISPEEISIRLHNLAPYYTVYINDVQLLNVKYDRTFRASNA